jgi:hypothetical protein
MQFRRLSLATAAAAVFLSMSAAASAASFSFTGAFDQDDDIRLFSFDLAATSLVTLQTWSYGGGTNAEGAVIPGGGFHPVVSLFSPSGMLMDSVSEGSCGPQAVDAATGLCGDAFLQQSLAAGSYTVALTQFFNVPVGPTLSGGFLQAGTGNFTGATCSDPGGSFLDTADIDCNQRSNQYALDITGVDAAAAADSAIPEPATLLLFIPAFLLMGFVAHRRAASVRV